MHRRLRSWPPESPVQSRIVACGVAWGVAAERAGTSGRREDVTSEVELPRGCLYSCGDIVKAMARVSSKNQVTLPVAALRAAGLEPGDEVTVRPIGGGEIVIAARGSRVRRHAGIATGIYELGELDRLRDEWDR